MISFSARFIRHIGSSLQVAEEYDLMDGKIVRLDNLNHPEEPVLTPELEGKEDGNQVPVYPT